ncbi:hypothetical protein XPA_001949 [Xanthoria parietina]
MIQQRSRGLFESELSPGAPRKAPVTSYRSMYEKDVRCIVSKEREKLAFGWRQFSRGFMVPAPWPTSYSSRRELDLAEEKAKKEQQNSSPTEFAQVGKGFSKAAYWRARFCRWAHV